MAMPKAAYVVELQIPIPMTPWPKITLGVPMSEECWTQMMAVLNAMKPGLMTSWPHFDCE